MATRRRACPFAALLLPTRRSPADLPAADEAFIKVNGREKMKEIGKRKTKLKIILGVLKFKLQLFSNANDPTQETLTAHFGPAVYAEYQRIGREQVCTFLEFGLN